MKLTVLMVLGFLPFAGAAENAPSWTANVPADKVIQWRRHFHRNPELSFKETKTADYIAGVLN